MTARPAEPLRRALRAACLLACSGTSAWTQTTGPLTGVVRDATDAVVPRARVTVAGGLLAAPIVLESDDQGRFAIHLPPGRYRVTAESAGLEAWSAEVEMGGSGTALAIRLGRPSLSEHVTVSATRVGAADIQSTPVAITALPAPTLEQADVERVEHLMGLVPTLNISQSPGGSPLLTIRGIGSNSAANGADPSVTMQLDGVYLARPSMTALDLLDVERVEVLRGPQGTLFGRNAIGGTINIVTRPPTDGLEARARLTVGNYDKYRVEGGISGPLVRNRIMGRFAFLRGSRDGFVIDVDHPEHSLGSEDTWAGRGQLRIVFGPRSELLVSGDYGSLQGVPLTLARPLAAKPGAPSFDIPGDPWSVRTNDLAEGRNHQGGASARLSLRVADTITLTSLTAYRHADFRIFVDSDTTELAIATTRVSDEQRQFSQEITLAQRTARMSWVCGAFWFDEHNPGPIELTLYRPAPVPFPIQFRGLATIDAGAWAVFGQAGYRLSRRLSVTGGIRYSHEREDTHNTSGTYRIGTSTLLGPATDFVDGTTDDAWTPKASLELQASPDTFLYLSATRGFKSGGVNVTAREPGGAFRPELAWSYEAGLKRTLGGGRGRLNAALFHIDYRDLQVQSFVAPGVIDVSNAGRATSRGVEAEGTVSAWRGLQLAGTVSWLSATYDRYDAFERGLGTVDASGKRLRSAPEWSGSGSAIYEFQTAGAARVSVRADVAWQSGVFFTPLNLAAHSQPAYRLVHLRAAFEPPSRRWELVAYVRNLARQEYVTGTWDATGDAAISGRPGEPRHWGMQLSIRH